MLFEEYLQSQWEGSVYHPNLLSFDADLEYGLDQRKEEFQPSLSGKLKNSYLNRFHIYTLFLKEKPYSFFLTADKGRKLQNREFFERQIIDSTQFGGNFGLRNKVLPMNFSFNNEEQVVNRAARPSQTYNDDRINFSATNLSSWSGETRFDFARDEFSRREEGFADQDGVTRDIEVNNKLEIGGDADKQLYSRISHYDLSGVRESRFFNLNERLDLKHNDFFNSLYTYDFTDRRLSDQESRDHRLNYDLRYRLYESLASAFNVHYANNDATSLSQEVYGTRLDVDYVKRLGKIGRVELNTGVAYDQEARDARGAIESVFDEAKTLTTGDVTFLDRPNADQSSVVVTDTTGTITYVLTLDYQLIPVGSRLQVQRTPGGTIPDGSQVLIDYRATDNPSFKFGTLSNHYRVGFDLLDSLCGIYYQRNKETHPNQKGDTNMVLQVLRNDIFGAYINVHQLKLEWEIEDYDSNLSPYKKQGFKESWLYNLTERTVYSIQSSQSTVKLSDPEDKQRYFDVINRITMAVNPSTRMSLEGGYRRQRGSRIDLDDITGRYSIDMDWREFVLTTEYSYENQDFLNDERVDHLFFTKIKRTF